MNYYVVHGLGRVATIQVDDWVHVVGPKDFRLARFTLSDWLARNHSASLHIDCDTAEQAWELIQHIRSDCLLWQCGACDAWIFTSNRPRIGVLQCSTCGDGGVDFRHADRHSGGLG